MFATYLSTYFSISYDFTNFFLDQLQLKIEIKDDNPKIIKKEQPEPDEESEPETKKIKTPEDDDDEVEEIKKNED